MGRRFIKRAAMVVLGVIIWRAISELLDERRRLAASGDLPTARGPWSDADDDAAVASSSEVVPPIRRSVALMRRDEHSTDVIMVPDVAPVPEPELIATIPDLETDPDPELVATKSDFDPQDVTRELQSVLAETDQQHERSARPAWLMGLAVLLAVAGAALSAWALVQPLNDQAWIVATAGAVCALIGIALALWPRRRLVA